MSDYSRQVRRAVLPQLKAFARLTELVPATSIYPSTVPASRTFPFIRYGVPIVAPFRASGLDSSSVRFAVHAFTKPLLDGSGAVVVTAEDRALDIGAAIKAALDGYVLPIEGDMHVTLSWLGSTPRQDPDEQDAWATSVQFQGEVAG